MFRAFGEFWKRYFDFRGKTGRRAFWLTVLAEFLLLIVCTAVTMLLFSDVRSSDTPPYSLLVLIFVLAVPTAALTVRRLRDAGYAWGWVFLFFLSMPGWIALAVLCAKPDGGKRRAPAAASVPAAPEPSPVPVRAGTPYAAPADTGDVGAVSVYPAENAPPAAYADGQTAAPSPENGGAPPAKVKKRRTWLWVLGWIFLFPVPVILLLRRSRVGTAGRVVLIILAWILWYTPLVLLFGNSEAPADGDEPALPDTELLAEVYPALRQIEDCERSDAAPASFENYLILRVDGKTARIISKNINGSRSLSARLKRADAEALDLIVVAVSDSFTRWYAPYADGERLEGTVPFRVEKADLYFFDPKTGTVFREDKVAAADLQRQESGIQTEFRLSNGQIVKYVDELCPLSLGFSTRFLLWFTQDLGFLVFIGLGAAAGLCLLLRAAWRAGQKKRAQVQR